MTQMIQTIEAVQEQPVLNAPTEQEMNDMADADEYEQWKRANRLTGKMSRAAYVQEFSIYSSQEFIAASAA